MYMVYWSESGVPRGETFGSDALSEALAFAEAQRARQHAGEAVAFVTLVAENPNQVGRSGVADPEAGYAWVKRRPPPRRPG
jgi:hypothetical protein